MYAVRGAEIGFMVMPCNLRMKGLVSWLHTGAVGAEGEPYPNVLIQMIIQSLKQNLVNKQLLHHHSQQCYLVRRLFL